MKKLTVIFIGLFFLLSGCDTASATLATIDPAGSQPATASATATTNSAETSQTDPMPSPTATGEAALPAGETPAGLQTATSGALTVQIFADEVVEVAEPQYKLSGSAPAGTVVTINDNTLVVDPDQVFNVIIPLEEGPNLVEVIASNVAGDEVRFKLVIFYLAE
jgi:hypothetical protein